MQKLKVMTILGTRPEIIRLSEVIRALDRHFRHVLVHTGQNNDYALGDVFFKEMELRRPDIDLQCVGGDLGETIGNIIAQTYKVMSKEKPDALLILGDTNSALSAISAKRLKIPIFHMEAGNRCFDQNVPEEINRRIVDHISDINLAYTEHSRRYLLGEGIKGDSIFVTGSPMAEVIACNQDKIKASTALEKLKLTNGEYFLVSAHREENIDNPESFFQLMGAINEIADRYKYPVVYSTHPRSRKAIEQRQFAFNPLVQSLPPFGLHDYIKLQQNAFCVLSDSGTLSEESALLRFPAVLIRTSTERPEVLDSGNMVIGGISPDSILQSVELVREMSEDMSSTRLPTDYEDRNVSTKVVNIIQSYTRLIVHNFRRK